MQDHAQIAHIVTTALKDANMYWLSRMANKNPWSKSHWAPLGSLKQVRSVHVPPIPKSWSAFQLAHTRVASDSTREHSKPH
jgi:hypothetical protein